MIDRWMAGLKGVTDVHIEEDGPVMVRVLGRLKACGICSARDFADLLQKMLACCDPPLSIVEKSGEDVKDFSCVWENGRRLRVRCYRSMGRRCLAVRLLPEAIPAPEMLGWPSAITRLCSLRQGLILVTGATGSGKSTTLAVMLSLINQTRDCHILTFEAPVEYRFTGKRALIHQCEVPRDVPSFAQGAQDALRMDADVIMLGELTDQEAMRAALRLAESGHLVLATMHAASAAEAVTYYIEHFAPDEQALVRQQLAAVLEAVIVQRLLRHCSEEKMVAAFEVLLKNTGVARQIREGLMSQLDSSIASGRAEGMVSLEESLAALVRSGALTLEDAMQAANRPDHLQQLVLGG